jgi:hypothetical protein
MRLLAAPSPSAIFVGENRPLVRSPAEGDASQPPPIIFAGENRRENNQEGQIACGGTPAELTESGDEGFPVLLGLADELGARLAIGADEGFEEPIDLRLECLLEGDHRAMAAVVVVRRGVALLCQTEEERLDGKAGEDLPLAGKLGAAGRRSHQDCRRACVVATTAS